ncbi:hypothetical protein [Limoniibacter endophyticus]|uniref:Lipoprotein n=1 Tax=Limoniibacter endophyticus TaxID=1565040 RepID=A0A8J3DJR0_9HYPH|nr:hypothetical protein [Limoniibacter endophyticus]GHC79360.1 hypothetical protein GCM10010136_31840 [Limoniibacter endophyticus]
MKHFYIALAAGLALTGCQYKAEPVAIGAFNVYSSYENKLPGKYLLYVDASALNQNVKPSDMNCAAHSYPLELAASFKSSTRQTLSNLVGELELVDTPLDRSKLAERNARGMIIVKGEQTIARIRVMPGFWSATLEADVEIVSSITVDGKNGRLLGNTVSGRGVAQADAGAFCEGGAKSLSQAASDAARQALTRLGEALNNSDRVRTGM